MALVDNVKSDPYARPDSIESTFRRKRFAHVQALIEAALYENDKIEILDLGGREVYWQIGREFLEAHRGRIHIHLVNTEDLPPVHDAFVFSQSTDDGCRPDLFEGKTFDIVHSNSVIEHVGGPAEMAAFARNVKRLGKRYFVQTPNFWFPLEPHFRTIGFQWLPKALRIKLVQNFKLGFYPKTPDYAAARDIVEECNLLSARDMKRYFDDGDIEKEKIFGLTKSVMAIRG